MKSKLIKRNLIKQLGQGMTEYIIIVALIAVAAIGVYQLFGETVQNQTAAIAAELGGGDGSNANTRATNAGDTAVTDAARTQDLSNYSTDNNASAVSAGGAGGG